MSRNARVGSIPIPSTIQASEKAFPREGFFVLPLQSLSPVSKGYQIAFFCVTSH